jgi:hypothetical protein
LFGRQALTVARETLHNMNLIDAPRMESSLKPGTQFDRNWASSLCVHPTAVNPLYPNTSQLNNRFADRFTTDLLLDP